MFFVLLAIALALLLSSGFYLRWSLTRALVRVGVGERGIRWCRRLCLWLLFAYPAFVFLRIAVGVMLEWKSLGLGSEGLVYWLFEMPFWVSVLVLLQSLPWLFLLELAEQWIRLRRGTARQRLVIAWGRLAVVLLLLLYTPLRIAVGGEDMELRHHRLGQPASGTPLRLLFMGDLQLDRHVSESQIAFLMKAIDDEPVELIIAGGDWINNGPDYIDRAAAIAASMVAKRPVLSVRGDHEHFAYQDRERSVAELRAALGGAGVELIDNELRWIEHEGKRIGIAFLNYNYIVRSRREEIEPLLEELASADYAIAVTHQLDEGLASLLSDRVDLVLAAHTHGGQVSPLLGLWHVPVARVETPFVRGRYRLSSRTYVVVTAGIGYSIAPFRYASPGSIDILEIYPREP